MTVRADRRPRAPRTKREPPAGRLRRRFAGRAEIASDCEIRRPEHRAMIAVVVITTGRGAPPPCMGAGCSGPIFGANQGRDAVRPVHAPRLPPNRWPRRHLMEGLHSINHGRGNRATKSPARHSAAREPSCRASSAKPDPKLRSSRRNIGTPIGRRRGPACAIVESGWGWVISPTPRFESRFPD